MTLCIHNVEHQNYMLNVFQNQLGLSLLNYEFYKDEMYLYLNTEHEKTNNFYLFVKQQPPIMWDNHLIMISNKRKETSEIEEQPPKMKTRVY